MSQRFFCSDVSCFVVEQDVLHNKIPALQLALLCTAFFRGEQIPALNVYHKEILHHNEIIPVLVLAL